MKLFTGSGFESEDRRGLEVTTDQRADYCEGMSHSTYDSSNTMLQKDQIDSPSLDEDSSEGSSNGRRGLKKGPWTTFEDAILVDYVKKHGEGNWNAVQKNTGLSRCGKSCRLRWANHLKPNLKKGAFTTEEEKLIIELHARMGNKWSRMAAHLPGRTDNEIKNYWNTRIKRCKRAGLPLYPSNISFQVSNANHHNRAGGRFTSGNRKLNELLLENTQEAPTVLFDYFKVDTLAPSYAPPSPKIPVSTVLNKRFGTQDLGSMDPIAKVADKKIHEGSESLFPGFQRVCNDPFEKFRGSIGLGGYPSGHTLSNGNISASKTLNGLEKSELPSLQYQESLSNGDISASKPFNGSEKSELPSLQYQETGLSNGHISASKPLNGSEKSELPSLQYQETDLCSWLAWSYAPFDEAVDMCVEYQAERSEEMDSVSPINSGLLEALIHEAQRLCGTKNDTSETSLSSPPATPGCKVEISSVLSLEERLWEQYDDPISPLGCSDASLFSNCSPTISGSSSDEFPPFVIQSGMNFGQTTAATIFRGR